MTRHPAFAPALLKWDACIVDGTAVWFEASARVGLVADLGVRPGEHLEMKLELVGLGKAVNAELHAVAVHRRPGKRRVVIEADIAEMRAEDRRELEAWLPMAASRPLPISLPPFKMPSPAPALFASRRAG